MKKLFIIALTILLIISLFACFGCGEISTNSVSGGSNNIGGIGDPLKPPTTVTLKLNDTRRCADCSIKFLSDKDMSASYYITPSGFDLDKLDESGYYMRITVTYDVYYKKDWDLGLGYIGSPRYELSLVNSDGMGKIQNDLPTSTTSQTKTVTYTTSCANLKNTRLILTFSTDNIQNIIYFKNIRINYQCIK